MAICIDRSVTSRAGAVSLFLQALAGRRFLLLDVRARRLDHLRTFIGKLFARLIDNTLTLGLYLGSARLEVLACLFGALAGGFRLRLSAGDFSFALSYDDADRFEQEAPEQPYEDKKIDCLQREC